MGEMDGGGTEVLDDELVRAEYLFQGIEDRFGGLGFTHIDYPHFVEQLERLEDALWQGCAVRIGALAIVGSEVPDDAKQGLEWANIKRVGSIGAALIVGNETRFSGYGSIESG